MLKIFSKHRAERGLVFREPNKTRNHYKNTKNTYYWWDGSLNLICAGLAKSATNKKVHGKYSSMQKICKNTEKYCIIFLQYS